MTTILITGASSGIGAALADVMSQAGKRLVLCGRNRERLAATAERCRERGVIVEEACFDITRFDQLVAVLEAADDASPIDIAILNAGLGGSVPRDRAGQDIASAIEMSGVNFTAPVVAANLLAERMAARRCGRIVLVGSVAGFFPLPMAPAYSGTKAGLAMFAEALRLRLADANVGVTLVSPGFIDTPMSRSLTEPKPFLMQPDKAAAVIARGIARGARNIIVPRQFAVLAAAAKLVPDAAIRAVLRRLFKANSA